MRNCQGCGATASLFTILIIITIIVTISPNSSTTTSSIPFFTSPWTAPSTASSSHGVIGFSATVDSDRDARLRLFVGQEISSSVPTRRSRGVLWRLKTVININHLSLRGGSLGPLIQVCGSFWSYTSKLAELSRIADALEVFGEEGGQDFLGEESTSTKLGLS